MLTKMKQVPQMSQLKIKDNTCKDKEEFHIIQGLTDKIADKTLDELEKKANIKLEAFRIRYDAIL